MPGKVLRCHRLLEDDIQDIQAVERSGPPQERLDAGVVLAGIHLEREIVEVPPGERACAFAHVLLRVVADPHREELHHLAAEVFVRRALHVVLRVKEVQHRGVLRDLNGQVPQVARGAALEQVDLLRHLAIVTDLVLVRGEVAVPQQRHLLLDRMRCLQHPVRPPVPQPARLEHRCPQPVEEPVGYRLHRAVAGRLALDSHRGALLVRPVGGFGPALGESVQRRIPQPGLDERLHLRIRNALVVHERSDRALEAGVGQLLDLLRRAAEARVRQQVRGAVVIPLGGGDGGQVVVPGRRSRGPAGACRHHRLSKRGSAPNPGSVTSRGPDPAPFPRGRYACEPDWNMPSVAKRCPSTFTASAPIHSSIKVAYT